VSLGETLTAFWIRLQGELFPVLDTELGPLGVRHQQFVTVLGLAGIETFVRSVQGGPGRPRCERAALARAFVAKAVFNFPTTALLIEMLRSDHRLRRLCGFMRAGEIPSEARFSRAFADFAKSALPSRLHAALIERTHADRLVGHISRDSTAIAARERPQPKSTPQPRPPRKRGRPRRGEVRPPPEPRRVERQITMSIEAMLADLPRGCDVGTKRNASGHQESWTGYKLHIDSADGQIPISCILTGASVHDSQVAIPLATLSAGRVTSLYDLMDSAYDVAEIRQHSRSLGHVPIIDGNPRKSAEMKAELAGRRACQKRFGIVCAEQMRYRERSTAERVNSALKDQHGGRTLRVRGAEKAMCHLMFGVLCLTALQLVRLVT
jgi:hypothetical protein